MGEGWQDEYVIWDCAAGTGNLLAGLTDEYRIWASTLDKADVDIMKDRIKNGANLLEAHVFQFDFLNDDLSKLPEPLRKIVEDPEKRKKLLIYDIREYFQGRNANGRLNAKSDDSGYNGLMDNFRKAQNELREKTKHGVYEHGFLLP